MELQTTLFEGLISAIQVFDLQERIDVDCLEDYERKLCYNAESTIHNYKSVLNIHISQLIEVDLL